MEWTKEMMRAKLATSDVLVERALLKMYARQTEGEKVAQSTNMDNGIGFNGTDAFILSSFAEWIAKRAQYVPEGKRLSPKQMAIARKKLAKYAGQLVEESK